MDVCVSGRRLKIIKMEISKRDFPKFPYQKTYYLFKDDMNFTQRNFYSDLKAPHSTLLLKTVLKSCLIQHEYLHVALISKIKM